MTKKVSFVILIQWTTFIPFSVWSDFSSFASTGPTWGVDKTWPWPWPTLWPRPWPTLWPTLWPTGRSLVGWFDGSLDLWIDGSMDPCRQKSKIPSLHRFCFASSPGLHNYSMSKYGVHRTFLLLSSVFCCFPPVWVFCYKFGWCDKRIHQVYVGKPRCY